MRSATCGPPALTRRWRTSASSSSCTRACARRARARARGAGARRESAALVSESRAFHPSPSRARARARARARSLEPPPPPPNADAPSQVHSRWTRSFPASSRGRSPTTVRPEGTRTRRWLQRRPAQDHPARRLVLQRGGRVPRSGATGFQFSFKFSLTADMYAQDSIDLLKESGIDFARHEDEGIDVHRFSELIMTSGLVLVPDDAMGEPLGLRLRLPRQAAHVRGAAERRGSPSSSCCACTSRTCTTSSS